MAGYIPSFDICRVTAQGFRVPIATGSVILYNVTAASTPAESPLAISSGGVVAEGSITGSVGDVIRISHATYPETCHFVLTATQLEAYTTPDNPVVTYVAENLTTDYTASDVAEAYLVDDDNPDVAPVSIGLVRAGVITKIPLAVTRETNYKVKLVSVDANRKSESYDLQNAESADITVPATGGGSVSLASKTELLTGTEAVKVVTPDVLAALWEQGTDIASSGTVSVGEGGYFNITGTTTITDIDFAVDKAGRPAKVKFAGALTLTHGSNLILPTAANIVTAAGDTAEFISEGSDVVKCINYERASGHPLRGTATSSTDNIVPRFDGTAGAIQSSLVSISDGGDILGAYGITLEGFGGLGGSARIRSALAGVSDVIFTLPDTGTNFTSTGTTGGILKQTSTGAGITVAALKGEDLRVNFKTHYLNDTAYGHTNSGLAAAITAIGSTVSKLTITEDITVSSSQTIPATCVLEILNGAKITVSSSATLTIGKFQNPGNVQCFAGVSSSNHVVFAAGAVEKFNLAWYMGIGSTSDCTDAMTDIFTSITSAAGGTVFIPAGSWKVHNLTSPNGTRLEGVGQGHDGSSNIGTRLIPKDGTTSYLIRTLNDHRNFSASHISFSVGTNTTTYGFRMQGTGSPTAYSAFGVAFDHCTFVGNGATSHYPLVTDDNDQLYEIMRANFYDCNFMAADNSKAVYIKSVNTQWGFIGCSFSVGAGDSFGIDAFNAGLTVLNCDFRGGTVGGPFDFDDDASSITTLIITATNGSPNFTVTSGTLTQAMLGQKFYRATGMAAHYLKEITSSTTGILSANATASFTGEAVTVYKWGNNASKAGCAIRVASGALLTSTIDSCADEGFNHFLKVIGGSLDTPVRLFRNKIQSKIYLENSTVFYAEGNEFYSNTWGIASGQVAHVYGENTYWDNTVEMAFSNPLTYAKPWGPERGGQFYFHDEGFMANAGGHTADRQGFWKEILETTQSALTRPLLGIYTTFEDNSTSRQLLQQWGVKDAASLLFKYGLNLFRDVFTNPGFYIWDSTHGHPFKGWLTEFITGYGPAVRGTVTQGTSRTTTVDCNAAHGIITCYTYASIPLQPGETIEFILNNTYLKNSSHFHVGVIDNATTRLTKAWCSDWGGDFAIISVKNEHLTNTEAASALKLKFRCWSDGGQGGISV